MKKNQESPSKPPTGHAASRRHVHWGWAVALVLVLGLLAVFGLLDMHGTHAEGHLSGTFHVSLLLLVAALALAFMDFLFDRAKGH